MIPTRSTRWSRVDHYARACLAEYVIHRCRHLDPTPLLHRDCCLSNRNRRFHQRPSEMNVHRSQSHTTILPSQKRHRLHRDYYLVNRRRQFRPQRSVMICVSGHRSRMTIVGNHQTYRVRIDSRPLNQHRRCHHKLSVTSLYRYSRSRISILRTRHRHLTHTYYRLCLRYRHSRRRLSEMTPPERNQYHRSTLRTRQTSPARIRLPQMFRCRRCHRQLLAKIRQGHQAHTPTLQSHQRHRVPRCSPLSGNSCRNTQSRQPLSEKIPPRHTQYRTTTLGNRQRHRVPRCPRLTRLHLRNRQFRQRLSVKYTLWSQYRTTIVHHQSLRRARRDYHPMTQYRQFRQQWSVKNGHNYQSRTSILRLRDLRVQSRLSSTEKPG
jgi:hypothetical protein